MTTPSAPPPAPSPERPTGLEGWLGHARTIAAIAGIIAAGLGAYYGAVGRLERVADRAELAVASAQAAVRLATESREAGETQLREYRTAADARIEGVKASIAATDRRVDLLEERLRAMSSTIDRMDRRQEVLLDRLNAPRTRAVRDYQQ
ncbi:hypothetical protein [Corallococcus silvisoli]|uniref:hypothetical protein n=1 Tax=Corallococcus silvisoli TaxID=2697031 RepID=UPI001378FA6E|nr:hypothetical protein [Corallococcus silvisoli]NBD11844.1 hypothetical protein [Corallococcus silvisoli]